MAGLDGPEKGRFKPGLKRAVLLNGLDIVKMACGRIPQHITLATPKNVMEGTAYLLA
jgi:hypothetical protein